MAETAVAWEKPHFEGEPWVLGSKRHILGGTGGGISTSVNMAEKPENVREWSET